MVNIVCDLCQCSEVRRMNRRGIFERWVYPLMSVYPFLCGRCGRRFMVALNEEKAGLLGYLFNSSIFRAIVPPD